MNNFFNAVFVIVMQIKLVVVSDSFYFVFQGFSYDDVQPHSYAHWIRPFMAECCGSGLGWTERSRGPGSSASSVY